MRAAFIIALIAAAMLSASALAAAPAVKHAKVDDLGFAFTPGTLKIKRDTKVTWKWVDLGGVSHNIAVFKGPSKFHSGLKSSGTFTHLFLKPGKYTLYCTIHPTMRETVIVK